MLRFGCSQREALRVVRIAASTYLYVSQRKDENVLESRIQEIADTRVHYGYRRAHSMLRREGNMDNVKRVYSLSREEGLWQRLKRPRAQQGREAQAAQAAFARDQSDLQHGFRRKGFVRWPQAAHAHRGRSVHA